MKMIMFMGLLAQAQIGHKKQEGFNKKVSSLTPFKGQGLSTHENYTEENYTQKFIPINLSAKESQLFEQVSVLSGLASPKLLLFLFLSI